LNLAEISSSFQVPESVHKISKRSPPSSSSSTNKPKIPSLSEMNNNFNKNINSNSFQVNSFNSRNLFSKDDDPMSKDLLTLLNSPIVLDELESRINSGQICNFMNNKNKRSKYRVFQKEEKGSKVSKVKGEPSFEEQRKSVDPDQINCESESFKNSTINRLNTMTIRNNFRHFAEIYNRSGLYGEAGSDVFGHGKRSILGDPVPLKLNNRTRSSKNNNKKMADKKKKGQEENKSEFDHERSKLNSIMSKIIAQYANQAGPNTNNDTIFFFSNLNQKTEDERNGQFFNIPLGMAGGPNGDGMDGNGNDLTYQRKPKMSFFVSAPFEGQAVILNDSYVVQDTIIMRIDCDVTKTEYIGYGSDPSDALNSNGNGPGSELEDFGEDGVRFGFDHEDPMTGNSTESTNKSKIDVL